ncbi:methylmalonyl-CoA mutase family protein [Natronospira bacteriovora]|uniref:Fused isobutyryl-CoA mutase n=1 Tax=Natronospira bacteriovora TaxID=3069753 RepID=A0ABU0W623_9GAMM|nr:methylmalonyl-CoA mutase family protein [Natronospira sp. AB-CW4]MDQ2069477.1 methylmalonyl-CoA mutase family protein [Natronospira sp. AB-CW4]
MGTAASQIEGRSTAEDTVPLRFVTAASLFDGHDAAINMIRRILQSNGAEVIHLGHNRAVADIVRAAIQEDADGIAVSSYQGGHMEYFKYMVDMLREQGCEHIRVVVGGGGTIVPHEIAELEEYGVEKVYTPHDGMSMGLKGMIEDVFERVRAWKKPDFEPARGDKSDHISVGRTLSLIEQASDDEAALQEMAKEWQATANRPPVVGITGTGGAGKSSLTDELLNRFRRFFPDLDIAVLAVDPTRRRTGGALLGDRIRMNSLMDERIFMRSMATRRAHFATSAAIKESIQYLRSCGFGLIILETAGIGQSDSEVVDLVDYSLYVMTSEFGAASQLEKIEMLDFADMIAINKFEKRGSKDALRDVRKQWKRNHLAFDKGEDEIPVYPTIASQFNDPGMNRLFKALVNGFTEKLDLAADRWKVDAEFPEVDVERQALIPPSRERYLAEIAQTGRRAHEAADHAAEAASRAHACYEALKTLEDEKLPEPLDPYAGEALTEGDDNSLRTLRQRYNAALDDIGEEGRKLLKAWPERRDAARSETFSYKVRGKEITGENYSESLSGLKIAKIGVPRYRDWGDILKWRMEENLPGEYPFTAGVYPYRREGEDPTRMFAGEGTPERTNRRFHYVAGGQPFTRLSTAFDSVTLYGEDPDERPDIYGRIGNSGVSIATVDDMKKLYSGFDLLAPTTSVSMTINGPAPIILAMFMNAAIDQRVEKYLSDEGRWDEAKKKIKTLFSDGEAPEYVGDLPAGHGSRGLNLLGVPGDQLVEPAVYEKLKAEAIQTVRGTVQADILKEDQAQNTCIFSTEFALKMMGDVQQYFSDNNVRNFYSVSISGYHIAEAGANPITQLALTLSNGFTIVEYYLARGMDIDDFAPNLSFFFSNGMDPEYAVIGRVARRIWARAMRDIYKGSERSQKLKYHIQTSGRSLHAQEIQFNDIRTTLQALYALYDNCNSLHTNAYDEAITTPTEESVRRAMAIQMIINKELGLNKNQNPIQGSFIIEELTDLVEEAVYQEFERIAERGGVLGAMETMYQRGKIQDESHYYEQQKHDGSLPIVGVNTFQPREDAEEEEEIELIRSTEEEKQSQLRNIQSFWRHNEEKAAERLERLKQVASENGNLFAELMEAVKYCSLGQITHALYEVGGQYRRNM